MTSYTLTVEPLGVEVECRDDQTILDACLRRGVNLPHACTHGTCGTCKVEVLDGDVELGDASAFALLESEREENKALICTATPRSDVTFEADVDVEEGVVFHPVQDFTGTLVSMQDCARDVRRLIVELDRDIVFNAGQYVQVSIPGTGVTRSWSMANPPSQARRIELQIRRTPGGVGSDGWVFGSLAEGDPISLSGPYGRFFLRPTRPESVLLIGGGTGLAPLRSMVMHALEQPAGPPLHLYHGVRACADAYDVEFLTGLAAAHERFDYHPVLSEEEVDGFAHGMVTDAVDADFETCRDHVGYLCGPPVMVDAALRTLMAKRLFPRDIYRENFFDLADKAAGVRSPLIRTG